MIRKTKRIPAIILALALCLSSMAAALAEEPAPPTPAKAAITKLLRTPVGTNYPTMTFTFTIDKKSVDGLTDATALATMPSIPTQTLTFNHSNENGEKTNNNITYYYLESDELFAQIINPNKWPHPGEYHYTVKETPNTNTLSDTSKESLTYSGAVYTLKVSVKQAPDGSYYVDDTIAEVVTPDHPPQLPGEKVDPTPGGEEGSDGDSDGDGVDDGGSLYSKMIFTNNYVKTNGPVDPGIDPEKATLIVSKTVTGGYGDKNLDFTFTMTITVPSIIEEIAEKTYTANIVGKDSTGAAVILGTKSFESSKPVTFTLKDGQKLMFGNTPVGTSYTVTESATTSYIPKCDITYAGTPKPAIGGNQADISKPLSTGDQLIGEGTDGDNSAAFTNDRDTVAPTGLNLNDLPFIGMIALAALGIGGYIVLKTRKGKNYN